MWMWANCLLAISKMARFARPERRCPIASRIFPCNLFNPHALSKRPTQRKQAVNFQACFLRTSEIIHPHVSSTCPTSPHAHMPTCPLAHLPTCRVERVVSVGGARRRKRSCRHERHEWQSPQTGGCRWSCESNACYPVGYCRRTHGQPLATRTHLLPVALKALRAEAPGFEGPAHSSGISKAQVDLNWLIHADFEGPWWIQAGVLHWS